jgi:hypothetical protein
MCKHILFGSVNRAILEMDMYNVCVTTEIGLRASSECWLERVTGVKSLNKNTMSEVHKKGGGKACMKFGSGECDKVVYGQAGDSMMRMTKGQVNE